MYFLQGTGPVGTVLHRQDTGLQEKRGVIFVLPE